MPIWFMLLLLIFKSIKWVGIQLLDFEGRFYLFSLLESIQEKHTFKKIHYNPIILKENTYFTTANFFYETILFKGKITFILANFVQNSQWPEILLYKVLQPCLTVRDNF